jgi:predicted transcriptional regulator
LQDAIGGDLAYNTVHTILTRLHDKGMVARVRLEGRPAYAPTKAAAQLAAERMRAVLEQGPDRATTLQHFVHSLSPADEQVLRILLSPKLPP